jgi:hypothetical protein
VGGTILSGYGTARERSKTGGGEIGTVRGASEEERQHTAVAARASGGSLLLPYLRVMRAPAVFSAIGDPLAGMLITGGRWSGASPPALALAAGSMYLGGMALNDVADREEDAVERPERPIPSGAVSVGAAAALGGSLLLLGWLAARRAGAPVTGAALGVMIVAYDFRLKHSVKAAPVAMGACRSLSLLMGAEASGGAKGVRRGIDAALLLGTYVAGVTMFARGETGGRSDHVVRSGSLLAAIALALVAARGRAHALPWVAATAATAAPSVVRAVRQPEPTTVGPAVGAMIRAIPAVVAGMTARRAPRQAAVFLPLLALARWGRKLIPVH